MRRLSGRDSDRPVFDKLPVRHTDVLLTKNMRGTLCSA